MLTRWTDQYIKSPSLAGKLYLVQVIVWNEKSVNGHMVSLTLALLLAAAQGDFDEYLDQARKRVESVWKYPDKAENLQATVRFNLDRAGRVSELKISKPSGRDDFDTSALEAVRKSSPFPPLLSILKRSETREVEMSFRRKSVTIEEPKPAGSQKAPQAPTPRKSSEK
jgi:TonB family protein